MVDERPLGPVATPAAPPTLVGVRREVLLTLIRAPQDSHSTVDTLAERLGVHPNSVRAALTALQGIGLVEVATESPSGRGRPAHRYAATVAARSMLAVEAARAGVGGDYRMLAEAFATHLARRRDAAGQAREVGGLWGLELMRRRPRSRRPASAASARHTVLGVLTDLGFGPEVGPGDEVRLRTCPILDSATTNPDVICSVHHGLVEGIRGALGRDEGTVGLEPFALPGACRLTLPR